MTEKRETWRDLLQPWAERFADLEQAIWDHCESLDGRALAALGNATHRPATTNAWWATYAVAPMVQKVVCQVQYQRHREAQASTEPTGAGGD